MCGPTNIRVKPYGLMVVDPQLSDDEGSTEAIFPRKVATLPSPALDHDVWMGMNQDFALDRNDDYEVSKVKARPVPRRNNAATPPPMDDDAWMAMNEDFACDWREEECVNVVAVKPRQIREPIEYGDYTMFGI